MPEQIIVRDEYAEILVYAIATDQWNQFVDFYNGLAKDGQGKPIEGVRTWLVDHQHVTIADLWSVVLTDCVFLIVALDKANTDWRVIEHLTDYLSHGFLHAQPQPILQIPHA